jgi:hypothetical protein
MPRRDSNLPYEVERPIRIQQQSLSVTLQTFLLELDNKIRALKIISE